MKGVQLLEENHHLKQVISHYYIILVFCFCSIFLKSQFGESSQQMAGTIVAQTDRAEQGQSSDSITGICNSADLPEDLDSSDVTLKLG